MNSTIKDAYTERSLYSTMVFTFVTLSVVALLFTGVLQLVSNFKMQSTVISDYQKLIAKQAAENVSNFIQEKLSVLETAVWLSDPIIQPTGNQKLILDSLLGLQPAFRQLALFDSQNRALARLLAFHNYKLKYY
jgi:hypothetical protein